MMESGAMTWCTNHRFVLVNVTLILIFFINTALFHVRNFDSVDDGGGGGGGTEDSARSHRRTAYRSIRAHEKRSMEKATDFTVPTFSKRLTDSWILVSLDQGNTSRHGFNESDLSFLDRIPNWTSAILGQAARFNHGCKSCLTFPNTNDGEDTPRPFFKALTTAINHGARRIFVMTSLHNVESALQRMTPLKMRGIIYSGIVPFKPCTHFAQPLLSWGIRSFLSCHDYNWVYAYTTGEFLERKVVGMCGECDQAFPQRSHSANRSYVYCDPTTPNVAVNPGRFVESLFENSLWSYDSFWAMFVYGLRHKSTSRTGLLTFSYIVQRLLWELHVSLSFVRSHDLMLKDVHSISNEIQSQDPRRGHEMKSKLCREGQNSIIIRRLVQYLYIWKCDANLTMEACVKKITDDLFNVKFLSQTEYGVVHDFLNWMKKTSYIYLNRTKGPAMSVESYIGSKAKSVRFWPSSKNRQWSQNPFHSMCSRFQHPVDMMQNNVETMSSSWSASSLPTMKENNYHKKNSALSSNIILVIVFKSNDPTTQIQMVNYYDYMYGRHFRHIIYCTSGMENIDMFAKMYPKPMTVIDLKESDSKLYSYLCLSEAMRMHHSDVSGYLHLDSETLLNPWIINKLHRYLDKPWLNAKTTKTSLHEPEADSTNDRVDQIWREKAHGRRAMSSSLQDLLFISRTIDKYVSDVPTTNTSSAWNKEVVEYLTKYSRTVKTFIGSLNASKMSQFHVRFGFALIYYVPVEYREQFIVLADQFLRYRVHSDIAVPTVIENLDSNFLQLNGSILTTKHTSTVLSAYDSGDTFLYPWDMYMLPTTKRLKFMCFSYLPQVEESLNENL